MQADLALVERAITEVKAGDQSAVHYLEVRYADVVRAYVASIVGDRTEAEDITRAVFRRLPTAIAAYEGGALPFEGWLLRLGRSSALDFLRRKSEMSPERLDVLLAFLDLAAAEHCNDVERAAGRDPSLPLA
jgi:DNA-directed RNA polymerase specialized sigma24 family protein